MKSLMLIMIHPDLTKSKTEITILSAKKQNVYDLSKHHDYSLQSPDEWYNSLYWMKDGVRLQLIVMMKNAATTPGTDEISARLRFGQG